MARPAGRAGGAPTADVGPALVVFVVAVFLLMALGMVMIYSASSIVALTSAATDHNPAYYVIRQGAMAAAGLLAAALAAFCDYHLWSERLLPLSGLGILLLLAAIYTPLAGADAYGATRWLSLGPIHLQPSEFAKPVLIMAAAGLIQDVHERGIGLTTDYLGDQLRIALVVAALGLILFEPDKGTTAVIGVTLALMALVSGLPRKVVVGIMVGLVLIIGVLALTQDYALARITMAWNPWKDEYGDGYQLIQGLYAFGSGGIFGVGLGNSRQKYAYLPMAHNDFIFAVIGEELGLVGTLLVLALFFLLVWSAFRIAKEAPDLSGTLIAAGCAIIMGLQMLVNVCGVLCLIPLSGKPIPFLSYGGSSIIGSLMMVGLVVSVARSAQAAGPASAFVVHEGGSARRRGLRLVQGGASTPDDLRGARDLARGTGGRISYNANGTRRIDLGPTSTDRLRSRDDARGRRG